MPIKTARAEQYYEKEQLGGRVPTEPPPPPRPTAATIIGEPMPDDQQTNEQGDGQDETA